MDFRQQYSTYMDTILRVPHLTHSQGTLCLWVAEFISGGAA
jgi:hypothetical protein